MLDIKKTLSKILNNMKQPIKVQLVTRDVTATQQQASNIGTVSAPNISGYTFLCWGPIATSGWIASLYPVDPHQQSSVFWIGATPKYTSSTTQNLTALALYIRSDLA